MIYSLHPAQGISLPGPEVVGNKAHGLMQMASIHAPVPPGFVLSVDGQKMAQQDPGVVQFHVRQALEQLAHQTATALADPRVPLLVSVRSGAPISMPGMMQTFLNVGITPSVIPALTQRLNDNAAVADMVHAHGQAWGQWPEDIMTQEQWAWSQVWQAIQRVWDSWSSPQAVAYRMHQGMPHTLGTAVIVQVMVFGNARSPIATHRADNPPKNQAEHCAITDKVVPSAKDKALHDTQNAAHSSGNTTSNPAASEALFSGTGVLFTRNPSTGHDGLFGEYLTHAQGEVLVSGAVTPQPIQQLAYRAPAVHHQLLQWGRTLEDHFRDMQDIEWTCERGQVWLLQSRTGKRSPQAAIWIACEQVREGRATPIQALHTLDAKAIRHMLSAQLNSTKGLNFLAQGLPASGGAVTGFLTFDPQAVKSDSILVLPEAACEDMPAMMAAAGVVTLRGGMTSHAAVVMRGFGKPCIVGLEHAHWTPHGLLADTPAGEGRHVPPMEQEGQEEKEKIGEKSSNEKNVLCEKMLRLSSSPGPVHSPSSPGWLAQPGDKVTLDGTTGILWAGEGILQPAHTSAALQTVFSWADEQRSISILANADTVHDWAIARQWGAQGIGLCRTEHMLFHPACLLAIQSAIISTDPNIQAQALARLQVLQHNDFCALFTAAAGQLVTVRLLDPPLHEFLPTTAAQLVQLSETLGQKLPDVQQRVHDLREVNPMLGHRGCRVGLTHPEFYRMQVRALASAAGQVARQNVPVHLSILVPLVVDAREMAWIYKDIQNTWQQAAHNGATDHCPSSMEMPSLGAMIETPRAALVAQKLAHWVDFVSFGTNDLTQMVWGLSRDDYTTFFTAYATTCGLLDPFMHFDEEGVGQLMASACTALRRVKPRIKIGVCGEHAADPKAIAFFQKLGVCAVSCAPLHIPSARIAAAQAVLHNHPVRLSRPS